MKKLLENPEKFYSPKKRPSGHDIGQSFGKGSKGAIPSNLLQISNTDSNGTYIKACRLIGEKCHPARFPAQLPGFFIRFLTEPGDLVLDIFAGSNTTGWAAEVEGRFWISFENEIQYVATSALRFLEKGSRTEIMRDVYEKIKERESTSMSQYMINNRLF